MTERTNAELRVEIANAVGLLIRPDRDFGKRQLNSIHWYITGESYFHVADYGTSRSPDNDDIRQAISDEVGGEFSTSYHGNRGFKKQDLQAICETVTDQSDRRPRP